MLSLALVLTITLTLTLTSATAWQCSPGFVGTIKSTEGVCGRRAHFKLVEEQLVNGTYETALYETALFVNGTYETAEELTVLFGW